MTADIHVVMYHTYHTLKKSANTEQKYFRIKSNLIALSCLSTRIALVTAEVDASTLDPSLVTSYVDIRNIKAAWLLVNLCSVLSLSNKIHIVDIAR